MKNFTQLITKSSSSFLLAFLLLIGFGSGINAQIAVTVTNPTNTTPNLAASYLNLTAAVTALNGVTAMTGPVTFTLAAGSETAPIKGFNISTSTAGVLNATNTLTIVGAGATTIINAGVGTANGPAASPDGMMYLSGSDYVTIDGITFTDGNTTNATVTMEFGIAFFKRAVGDGCNNNRVQNCTFNMRRINNAAGTVLIVDGSCAIQVLNSTAAAATTALTPTNGGTLATNGTNSNNVFYSNIINDGNAGIHLGGFAATVGVGPTPTATTFLGDLNNILGASTLGNTISNFGGGAATNPAVGIRANNQWSVSIAYNTIDNNTGTGVNHATTLRGIFAQAGTSAAATISNNTVTVRSGATISALTAIENRIGSTAVSSNTININNNTIRFSYTTATSGVFTAINNSASAGTLNIGTNNIQQLAATNYPSTGTIPVIVVGSPGGPANVTNNTISNFNMTSAAGGILRAITASTPTGLYTVTGNTIENLSYSTAASTGSITGIYNLASATLQNVNSNIIRNFSTPTTGTLNGIQNNTAPGTFQCRTNQIYNFTTTAGGAGGFSANGITWTNAIVDVTGNIIYSINSTGSTGGTGGTINGITVGGNCSIIRNAVYDLSSNSTGATINGIAITGGTGTNAVNNNLVGDIRAPFSIGNIAISGILISSGTTNNIFHNTVNIAATTSSPTTFGSSAIYFSSATPVNNLRNNIFVNTSAAGPTGGFAAAMRYTTTPTSTNFPAANNNNLYFVGVPAANKVIYCEGSSATPSNGQQTLANYKTYIGTTLPVSGREGLSVSQNPAFVSTTGSNPITNFLQYPTASATLIEQGAATGTGITTDFSGTTLRCPNGLCPGGGAITTPDIGAWELNNAICNSLSATVTPNTAVNYCSPGGPAVAMTGAAGAGGTPPYTTSWSPITNLWTNAGATTAYSGGAEPNTWATPAAAGSYTFTVTDASGCVRSASRAFTTTPGIVLNVTPTSATSCPDVLNLSATATKPAGYDDLGFYTFGFASNGSLLNTTGSTAILTGINDDNASTVQNIGFTFNFGGVAFTQYSINSNGQLRFGSTAIGTNVSAPVAGVSLLFPMTGDNEVNNGVHFLLTGSAPNRRLIIEWREFYVNFVNLTNAGNMQVWLDESTNQITYVYGNIFNSIGSSQTRSIGLATSNTATTAGSVTVGGTPTFALGATFAVNTFAAGSGTGTGSPLIANLGSAADGSRWVYTFTPPAFALSYAWSELGGNPTLNNYAGSVGTSSIAAPSTEILISTGAYGFPVTVTNSFNGCTASGQANVTIATNALSAVVPTVDFATRCFGQTVTLTGTNTFSGGCGPYTFEWRENGVAIPNYTSAPSASSSGTTITVASTTGLLAGMFLDVTAGTGAFPALARVSSIVNATTFIVSAAPTTALVGATIVGRANGTLPFAATSNILVVTPPVGAPVVYQLRITDAALDFQAGTVNVTVNALPTVLATPASSNICTVGASPVALVASGAVSYTWSPVTNLFTDAGVTTAYVALTDFANVWSNTATARTYTVTGTDANGCTNTATANIALTTPPVITSTTATPPSVCSGANSQLLVNAVSPSTVPAYSFAQTSGTFTAMVGGTASTAAGDDGTQNTIPIGFTFNYRGAPITTFSVSTNGNLVLGATNALGFINGISTATNVIAPMWDDNNLSAGSIKYQVTGTSPNQVLTVEWLNVSIGGGGATTASVNQYQVRLFESNGNIQFIYGNLDVSNGISASIGIAGGAVAQFLSVTPGLPATASSATANNAVASIADIPSGTIYTFAPPPPSICSNALWNLSAGVIGGSSPYTYLWSAPGITGLSSTSIANPTVINAPDNTYTINVQDACGANVTQSVSRDVDDAPTLSITSPGLVFCSGNPLPLTATSSPALNITWSGGTGLSTNSTASGSPTFASPATAQTYTATTDLDGNGCRASGTIGPITTAISPSLASFTANPSAACVGGNTTLTATPAPGIAYCNPSSGVVNVDNITTVVINTLNKSGLSGQLYTNYPAIAPNTTTLVAGTSYNITVGVQSSGIVSVWFDFNKNGVFEVSEWFQPMTTGASGTVSVPVPAGAINGPTRMRVRSRSSGSTNGAANFCEAVSFFSGNSEDFTVTITGGVNTVYNYTWSETPNSTITPANVNSLVASALPSTSTYTVVVDDGTCSATQNLVVLVAPLAVSPVVSIVQGASNYEFTPSGGTFNTIVGAPGAVSVPTVIGDDVISSAIPLGFNFTFAGTSYSNVYASSNGFISFNAGAGSDFTNNLAGAAAGNYPLLAPLWDDIDGSDAPGTAATYLVTGAPGSRVFTFEWTGWEWLYTTDVNNISFQIKLYEANGRIEFIYSPIQNPGGTTPSASIGIASAPGNFISLNDVGTNPNIYSFFETNNLGTNPADGQVYAFTPPVASCPGTNALITAGATAGGAPYTYSWTSVPPGFTSTASAINVKPDVTTTYNVVVTDDCGVSTPGSATVTVTANPMTVTPSNPSVCGNNPVTINFSGAGSYSFFPNYGIASSTLTSITSVAPPGFVPLAVTGFNSDVVANGIGNVSGSTTADVDGSGNAYFNDFSFQQGPSDPTQAFGAPTNNLVESFAVAGLRYNLAAYTANNSLRLAPAASGTLNTPSNPIATNVYALVAYGGTGGNRTFDATITFTDASTQVFTGLTVKNWLTGTAYSAAGFGYVNNIGVQQGTTLTPRLFDVDLAISVPNQTKQVASVSFTYTDAAGVMHVLALTARTVLPAPSITYTLFGTASGCEFSRQATINYTTPPPLSLTSSTISICEGIASPANLVTSNPADYQSWVWTPTPGDVTGNQNTGFIFNPANSKTLTLNASQTGGSFCNATATVNVTVNGNPGAGTATATPTTICQNSNVALTGSGFNPTNTGTLLTEGFESGVGTNFAVSGAGITASATGIATPGTGAVRLVYTDGLSLAGVNNSYELQNDINLNGNASAQLLFNHICALEGSGSTFDRGVVQYSIDGGANWVAFPAASYTGFSTLTPAVAADGIVFSTRSRANWISALTSSASVPTNALYVGEAIDIPSAALTSSQFRVRFKITSDGSVQYSGWYLDNIRIVATAPALTYAWSGNGGFTTASAPTIPATLTSAQPANAGTFTLTATNPAGCISEAFTLPLVIDPTPTVANQTQTICSGSTFSVTPVAPGGTTYTWTAPAYDGVLISGGSAEVVGQTSISQTLVNTSGAIRTATYTVTPRLGLCDGATFTVTITVYPTVQPPTFLNFSFGGANYVTLEWIGTPNAVATGVVYTIEIDDDINFSTPDFGTPQTMPATATTRFQNGLISGLIYYYRIRAVSAFCSTPSAWSTVTPFLTTAKVWLGNNSTDWNTNTNWGPDNNVPTAVDNIIIFPRSFPQFNPVVPSAGLNGVCANMILRPNSLLTISSGKEVNVKGNLSNIGAGVVITGPGKIHMNGTVVQSITGAGELNNLEIDNTAGVNMPSGVVSVRGIVTVSAGVLTAGDNNLSLISNAAGTAMISGLSGTGNVTGNVQVNRFMPGPLGYRYVSSPIQQSANLQIGDFDAPLPGADNLTWNPAPNTPIPSPFPTCWYYDETIQNPYAQYGWISETSGSIVAGRGYSMITPANHTASLTGPVNNGAITLPNFITRTPGFPAGLGVNLIGNPYPSPISWNAFYNLNGGAGLGNISAVVKRFVSSGLYYGQYVDWNGSAGTPSSVGDNIALGQSFFITKLIDGVSNVSFDNTIRRDNTTTTFYEADEPQISSLLRMQLIGGAGADEFVLYFDPNATDNYDVNIDAIKFLSETAGIPNIYTNIDSLKVSINALKELNHDMVIPMGIVAKTAGSYQVNVLEQATFAPTSMLYLEDRTLGIWSDLRTTNQYIVNLPVGEHNGRFFLHFRPAVNVQVANETCQQADGQVTVTNASMEQQWTASLLNVAGQVVAQSSGANITFNSLSDGTYTLRLVDANGYIVDQLVTVEAGINVSAAIAPLTSSHYYTSDVIEASVQDVVSGATYEWYLNGVLKGTGTQISMNVTEAGVYTLTLKMLGSSCVFETNTSFSVTQESTVGIETAIDASGFIVYPNPMRDVLNVKINDKIGFTTLSIHDAAGRLIHKEVLNGAKGEQVIQVQMNDYAAGLYQITLEGNQKRSVAKFSKTK